MRKILAVAVVMILFTLTVNADAASIWVERIGTSNVYVVKSSDLSDVGGVEVEIQYDTATLSNPKITQGAMLASTMFVANPKFSSSSVKIAAMSLSTIKGSGDLATISFDVKGDKPGFVTVGRSKLAAATGTPVKHDTPTVIATGGGDGGGGGGGVVVGGGDGAITVAGSPSVGTITLPTDQLAATDKKTDYQPLVTDLRKDMTLPLAGSESAQSSAGKQPDEKGKEQEKKSVAYKGALQLISELKGEKSAKRLISLFAEVSIPGFTQEPPIAFSDGKTLIKLSLVLKQSGSDAPKFILQGANVKLLHGEGEDVTTWTIDAIPKKDAVDAKLTVIDGQNVMEIPLSIVPRIDPLLTKTKGKVLSEADFDLYLSKPAKFDFNKDEKFDSVDDFIYTANYIVAMKIKPEKLKKEDKKEPAKTEIKTDTKAAESAKSKDEKVKDEKVKDEKVKNEKVKDEKVKTIDKPLVKP